MAKAAKPKKRPAGATEKKNFGSKTQPASSKTGGEGLSDAEFAKFREQMKKSSAFGEKMSRMQKETDSTPTPDYNRLVAEQHEEEVRKYNSRPARIIHMLRGQSQGKDGRWLENRMGGGGGFVLGPKLQIEDEWAICGYHVFGRAHIIRGGSRISALDAFLDRDKGSHEHIQDGDIVQTGSGSYIWSITTGVRAEEGKEVEEFQIDMGPNSKARFHIRIEKSHGKEEGGEYFTLIEHKISKVELIEGIFRIKINGANVNRLLEIAANYPQIEFAEPLMLSMAGASKFLNNVSGQALESIKKTLKEFEGKAKANWKRSQTLDAYIELSNGTLVVFGCANKIISPGGQETKLVSISEALKHPYAGADPQEFLGGLLGNNTKSTFSGGTLSEADLNLQPDAHISEIAYCMNYALGAYLQALDAKKELATLKDVNMKTVQADGEKAYKEAEQMLQDAKDIDDPELIKVAKAMLEGAKKSGEDNELNRGMIEAFKIKRKLLEKQAAKEGELRRRLSSL